MFCSTIIWWLFLNSFTLYIVNGEDPCDSSPCLNGGTFSNSEFRCACPEGFEGVRCEKVVCRGQKIDIVYLLDGSRTIWSRHFESVKKLTQELNSRFDIGTDEVRVAVQQYSEAIHLESHLNEVAKNGDLQTLNSFISSIEFITGPSFTGLALEEARTQMLISEKGDRADVPDFLILFAHGLGDDGDKQITEADRLKGQGVTIFSIGVGGDAYMNTDSLQKMASMSHDYAKNLLYWLDSDEFDTVVNDIVGVICQSILNPMPGYSTFFNHIY